MGRVLPKKIGIFDGSTAYRHAARLSVGAPAGLLVPKLPLAGAVHGQVLGALGRGEGGGYEMNELDKTTGRALPHLIGDDAPCSNLCYCERPKNFAEIKLLRAALAPLAAIPLWRDAYPDASKDQTLQTIGCITVDDVRAARAALGQMGPTAANSPDGGPWEVRSALTYGSEHVGRFSTYKEARAFVEGCIVSTGGVGRITAERGGVIYYTEFEDDR